MQTLRTTTGPVPSPAVGQRNKCSITMRSMQPGQEFDAPPEAANVARVNAHRWNKTHTDRQWLVRAKPHGITVYCVAVQPVDDLL